MADGCASFFGSLAFVATRRDFVLFKEEEWIVEAYKKMLYLFVQVRAAMIWQPGSRTKLSADSVPESQDEKRALLSYNKERKISGVPAVIVIVRGSSFDPTSCSCGAQIW